MPRKRRIIFSENEATQTQEDRCTSIISETVAENVYQRKSARFKAIEIGNQNISNETTTQISIGKSSNRKHKTEKVIMNPNNIRINDQPSRSTGLEIKYKDFQFNYDFNNDEIHDDSEHSNGQSGDELDTIQNHNTEDNQKEGIAPEYIDEGDPTEICIFCGAELWLNERVKKDTFRRTMEFSICCLKGKVVLPTIHPPPPMLERLFFDKKSMHSKDFLANIRQYNNMFSFTSMGGKINHSINSGGGPYSFILSGMNYHMIGSLLPLEGARPVYSQLYIYDTENEVTNRIAAVRCLNEFNPFVKQYRMASSLIKNHAYNELKLCLIGTRQHDGRNYNLPSASEVAALVVGDIDMSFGRRDIIIEELSGSPQRISELHASYLPLQYPILFPFGEDGYRDDIDHREETLTRTKKKKKVSMREYFSYRLMSHQNEVSILLHARRLLQQFIVDGYTMIESQRLLWVRTHQKELRVDLYQGLSDALINGERNASATGRRIILPSSFTGGARYMLQNYQDAMAICRWADIQIYFLLSLAIQHGQKLLEVYTIEFQKRGLPHAHILLFLDKHDKINDSDGVDRVIFAEIPDKHTSPKLYDLVKRFMMHGPCGTSNPKSPCMKDKKCSKYFPKKFNNQTVIDEDGYPTYKRRNDGRDIEVKGIHLDNRFVVPYNSVLLTMFQAHINVEKCNHSTSIKYLFKYISKGNDRVVATIYDNSDEIQQYYNCRYISACEGSWRIFGFDIHHRHPSVERLSFHLPNQQPIVYSNTDDVAELLDKPRVCESQFLAWMEMNGNQDLAKTLTYSEFPHHYVYERNKRAWKERKRDFAVGRITHVSPSSGELYFLRILLTKVKGPTSFDDIKTVNGVIYPTFKDACFALGLLDDDREYINAIREASVWASGVS
ncbi:uncharacterized protein LOC129289058 [Prosopis cineraria]|uniref:uncharacterized protein LOC129289058 n=1 Tax=Prosopis cineraria TaxID=364024 RepID=UPI0024109BEC|nr:uncharacterized protein LOC129289058 [Prosopis cineraria]